MPHVRCSLSIAFFGLCATAPPMNAMHIDSRFCQVKYSYRSSSMDFDEGEDGTVAMPTAGTVLAAAALASATGFVVALAAAGPPAAAWASALADFEAALAASLAAWVGRTRLDATSPCLTEDALPIWGCRYDMPPFACMRSAGCQRQPLFDSMGKK